MAKKVLSRHINPTAEKELWAKSAGRCQFNGCNRILYKSPVTQEPINISEKAHIYSFSEDGPRGWSEELEADQTQINDIDNLMLLCHDCHKTIDKDIDGDKYSADLLKKWKQEHEQRVFIASNIVIDKTSHVVLYSANIGDEKSPINKSQAFQAMFPDKYPVSDIPISLSTSIPFTDKDKIFWETEVQNLEVSFREIFLPKIKENNPSDFSIFAMAPMPLLIKLGSLFTDKISVDTYQPIREPKTWRWQEEPKNFEFIVTNDEEYEKEPVLILSLSGKISRDRIYEVVGNDVNIWEVTVPDGFLHNDFMRSKAQLSLFRKEIRKLMVQINEKHSKKPLKIFPATPISCAIELGRVRMPKSDMQWIIYDQNNKANKFIEAITIGEAK
ncbi:SAVED domain-containing protein [Sulfurimonas sp.]|uniref:SAVED domain-containing protein n=1 Tax=Sulfurimonas sp. TaxID=2022749 RepID=UPI00356B1370